MKQSLMIRACTFVVVSAIGAGSSAAIVEIAVSGRIGVDDPLTLLPDEIRTGEPWTGLIRYDIDIADQDPDPKRGYYFDASRTDGISIAVNVHGNVFSGGNGELQANVLNDIVHDPNEPFNFPPGDSFSIGGPMRQSPRLLDHSFISFSWNNPAGEALLNDSLPTNFDPFMFVQTGAGTGLPTFSPIYVRIEDTGLVTPTAPISYTVIASIEAAAIRIVPEPGAFGLGILASAMMFRRRAWLVLAQREMEFSLLGVSELKGC